MRSSTTPSSLRYTLACGDSRSVLSLQALSASYGPRSVLDGIRIIVGEGDIVGLLGHNGAGKTTLLRIAAGLKAPDSGIVNLSGRDVTGMSAADRARKGLALVPEGVRGFFPNLTIWQNVKAVRPSGVTKGEAEKILFETCGDVFADRMDQLAGSMSGGQRQMLAISLALIRKPKILLLDEPSTGLAPAVVERIFKVVSQFREGVGVMIVEQDLPAILAVATRVVILKSGRTVAEFERHELPSTSELWQYY